MSIESPILPVHAAADAALQVYLLGLVEFESALVLQRRLAYQVAGDRDGAVLLLCEHPPLISVGRQGSRAHILCEPEEIRARQWRVRWVNRGGGCVLHQPGQLAVYPILPLDRLGLGVRAYLDRLHETFVATLDDFKVRGETRPDRPGVWVGRRPVAATGVAVRDWVSYYGTYFNINPDLEPFRRIRCAGSAQEPMTSVERERRGPLRPSLVRERFLEHFTTGFGFTRTILFSEHPALSRKPYSGAVAASY